MPALPRAARSGRVAPQARAMSPDTPKRVLESADFRPITPNDLKDGILPTSEKKAGNRPRAATPNTSGPTARQDRRFWPRDTRGLLELCEQGYALQQGMKSHCQETADGLERLQDSTERTVSTFLDQMQQTLLVVQEQFAKPANIDWTPAVQLIESLEPAIVKKVACDQQQAMQRLECQLDDRIMQALKELQNSKEREESHNRELQEEVRREMKQGKVDMEEAIGKSLARLDEIVTGQTLSQGSEVQARLQELTEEQRQMRQVVDSMEPLLKVSMAAQIGRVHSATRDNHQLIDEIHDTVHQDIMSLFHEIGKIQKEMNINFVLPQPRKGHQKKHGAVKKEIELREMWAQTDYETTESAAQTDLDFSAIPGKKKKVKQVPELAAVPKALEKSEKPKKNMFADEEKMKMKMRQALIKPAYDVTQLYHKTGCAQAIARHPAFENLTFAVIMANALWIAVDTDYNHASLLIDADLVFQVVDNSFCGYFFLELMTRFLAFQVKRWCLRDFWFVFDFFLVFSMVLETWIMTAVMLISDSDDLGSQVSTFSILRLARLVKMLRMARMARLLRMVPELVVIIRGIGVAFRSVSFFILLCLIIIYVFGVGFTQISKGTELGEAYFPTVPNAMKSLLLDGMLPLYVKIVEDVTDENPLYWPVIMLFILLASVTVMNMLIGVLVEVVRTVASTEKERMTVTHVTHQLKEVMKDFQNGAQVAPSTSNNFRKSVAAAIRLSRTDTTGTVAAGNLMRQDFETFISKPEVTGIINEVGVDAVGLIDMADMIYEDKDKEGLGLSFVDFIDVVLNMRGTNPSTVKDLKQQMRVIKTSLKEQSHALRRHVGEEVEALRMELVTHLVEIRRKQLDGSDVGSEVGEYADLYSRHQAPSISPSMTSHTSFMRDDDTSAVRFSAVSIDTDSPEQS